MTLPWPAVLRWRPDALATTAERLRWHRAVLEAQVDRVRGVRRSSAGHWHGDAGDAAGHRLAKDVADLDALLTVLDGVRARLDGVADALAFARSRVATVVEDAEAHGFRVSVDGTVHPPYLPPPGFAADTDLSGYELRADRLLQEASERTTELRTALREAELADEHQALSLRSLELPMSLVDVALLEDQRLPDTWGGPGDAVAFPEGWEPWRAMGRGSDQEWLEAVLRRACLPGAVTGEHDDPDDDGTGYFGGGFVTGPDGRRYPLVVPQILRDDRLFRSNANVGDPEVADLMGRDAGWHQVGRSSGIDRFGAPMPAGEKAVIGLAGGLGLGLGPGTGLQRRNDLLPRLTIDRLGAASLAPAASASPRPPGIAPGEALPEHPDPPGVHRERIDRLGGALTLVTNAAGAATLVRHLDDRLTHGYTLALQQNQDGRRRALLQVYDVYDSGEANVVVQRHFGYVDPLGRLGLVTASPLSTGAVVGPAPGR